jgi:hypothetical protein
MIMRKDSLNQENFLDDKDKKEEKKEEKKEGKKNEEKEEDYFKEEIFEEKENELEKELILIINQTYGNSILDEINFEQLLTSLMEIIYRFIKKPESDYEERQIVCTGINLWSMIIISQENVQKFLEFVYNLKLTEDNVDFDTFVIKGLLYSQNIFLRLSFLKNLKSLTNSLYQLCEYSFLIKLLNQFMSKFFDISKKEKINWKYFYILLEYLVETGINNEYLSKIISKLLI